MTRRTALAVIHTPSYGGPHNQIALLARPLADAGWRYVVATTDEPGEGAHRLRGEGVEVHPLKLRRPRRPLLSPRNAEWATLFMGNVRALRRLALATEADVVQVCGLMYPQGALAARGSSLPLVWQLLGLFPPPMARRLLTPLVVRLADVVMTAGEATARAHPGLEGNGRQAWRFYPPVDTARFKPDADARHRMRGRLEIAPDEVVIGTIANAVPAKRLELLADAVARAAELSHAEVRLLIAGGVPLGQERYWQRTVSPALGEAETAGARVTVLREPEPESIPDLYRVLDVFALTSNVEGVPTTVLEALATGVPVVATSAGGVGELLAPAVGCALPVSTSSRVLGEVLARLIGQSARRAEMRKSAPAAVARYSPRECARAHVSAFEEAIRRRAQASRHASLSHVRHQ
jgi:glycosyltransferase involved in cell wall biosynthesis